LNSLSDLRLVRIAVIGALVAALGLAGCGRKGGLDPPPGATAAAADQGAPPGATAAAADQGAPPGAAPPASPDALPPSTQPLPRRTPIDWLID
jgi:predicted small lipoprotein YifL